MCKINLTIVDDKVKVESPYNEKFVNRARNLRGSWRGGAWWFDDSIIDYVRELMMECFGTTGETPYDECELLVSNFSDFSGCSPVVLFGRTIARAYGRDSGARLGDDIVLISGNYNSGGSVKNWRTEIRDATFIIKNFPVPSLELPSVKTAIKEGWCEVKYPKKKRKLEDIQADIEKYKSILDELEKELNDAQ